MTRISIVVPCRDEERFIEACLSSALSFTVPASVEIEVLVMDGMSQDRTAEIVRAVAGRDARVKLRRNPGRIQSTALNLAIGEAAGEWIMRLDAHSVYPPDYVQLCLETAQRTGADNVGGIVVTQPGDGSYQARLVQALTTHRFGVGNSGFRVGAADGPADTVPFGFFRRDLFDRIGLFDERLLRAQDYEFNRRIIASGGRVWRNPEIHISYHNQPRLAAFYRKQFEQEAPYNVYMWYVAPYAVAWRHGITGAFAAGVIGGAAAAIGHRRVKALYAGTLAVYAVLAALAGAQQAVRYRDPRHAVCLPWCFAGFHLAHGLGILSGLARLATGRAPFQVAGGAARRPRPARVLGGHVEVRHERRGPATRIRSRRRIEDGSGERRLGSVSDRRAVPRIEWPDGKDFAFTVFDDTDRQTLRNGPELYALLDDLGIRTTKSVWPLNGPEAPGSAGATCEDPAYLEWVRALQRDGFEIALHNVTPTTSPREVTVHGIERFRELFGRYPSAHTNHTGCLEAIYWGNHRLSGPNAAVYNVLNRFATRDVFEGHVETSPLFWGDVCRKRVKYVRNFIHSDVNTLRFCPRMPYHDPLRPYVKYWFASTEGADVNSFKRALSEENQDRLEAEGGACIMYTHFGFGFAEDGRLDPEVARLMRRLARKNGWFVPVTTLLDHLLAVQGHHDITNHERARIERSWLAHKIRVGGTT